MVLWSGCMKWYKLFYFICFVLVCVGFIIVVTEKNHSYNVIANEKSESKISSNAISMLYETEAGSGEYQISTDTTWPQDGYVFNERLSGCENGGTLSWNEETKRVIMQTNKSDKCYVYFDIKKELMIFSNFIINNMYIADGINNLYYHDGLGSYVNSNLEANDLSYRYSGNDYQVTSKAIGDGYIRPYSLSSSDTLGVINYYCNGEKKFVGYYCGPHTDVYYTIAYDESTKYEYLNDVLTAAVNFGYLTNFNVKNFVCFGSDAENCPDDNLYRIIGIFNYNGNKYVKIIKSEFLQTDSLGTDGDFFNSSYSNIYGILKYYKGGLDNFPIYYWNNSNDINSLNNWKDSNLNNVNLNINYINYIGNFWSEMIETLKWYVSGGSPDNFMYNSNVKETYDYEVGIYKKEDIFWGKIGLIYVSDYYYTSLPNYWSYPGYTLESKPDDNGNYGANYDYRIASNDSWLYKGVYECTISRNSDNTYSFYNINFAGNVSSGFIYSYMPTTCAVRPVFYLKPDVQYVSGNGDIKSPFRISY